MYKTILVPLDGSDRSLKALEVARHLATPHEGKLYLLNVPDVPPAQDALGLVTGAPALRLTPEGIEGVGKRMIRQVEENERAGRNLVEQIRDAVGLSGVQTEAIVRMGRPAEVIIEEAERLGVDAIVLGSRGMSDFKGLIVGSVSHKVLHTAKCSVIVVH